MKLRGHVMVALLFVGLVAVYTPTGQTLHGVRELESYNIVVMRSIFHNLLTQPRFLMEGPGFYPFGSSLTLMEPLLTPALVMGPLVAVTRNDAVAFKLTLLLFWALSGWAMYAVTFWLTQSHPAALVAALVFTVCPARLHYYEPFQVGLVFGMPLAIYALVRFLEEQRVRYLAALLGVFWLQAVAVVYYGVILGVGLAVVAAHYVALRWQGWRLRTLLLGVLGGATLLLALAPIAGPYFVTRRELGFERGLGDALSFAYSADLLAYVTTDGTWLSRVLKIHGTAESPLFVGLAALTLAAVGLLWLRRADPPPPGRTVRLLTGGAWAALAVCVLAIAIGRPIRVGPVRSPFSAAGAGLLILLVTRHAVRGWERWRHGVSDRRLAERDWVSLLLGVIVLAVLLSLGPIVYVAGHPLGKGLHAWLYPYVFPLHAIRLVTRFGLLAIFAVSLLAGFGMKWLTERLPARARWVALVFVPLLLLDAAGVTTTYKAEPVVPRTVDAVIRADPDDVVVLEWPINVRRTDSDATFRSLAHGKRVVNGFAGFTLDLLRQLSGLLSTAGSPFPIPAAQAALRRIHPLRYLVVRIEDPDLPAAQRPLWRALRQAPPPLLRFRGTFGAEDLYEVVSVPEQGVKVERLISYDLVRRNPVVHLTVRSLTHDPLREEWVDAALNGRAMGRIPLSGEASVALTLTPPFWHTAPNILTLTLHYSRPAMALDAAYEIGTTGVRSPGDLRVLSAGQPQGSASSIQFNDVELSPNRRGYNLVALAPSGQRLEADAFDTFADGQAAHRLTQWIAALPPGTLVAGAVRDEGSGHLTAEAVQALRTLGVAGDLRGHFREAHAFIGAKGTPAGSAVEALGPHAIQVTVGHPTAPTAFELTDLTLGAR
jgi:hypothetical protein